MRLNEADSNCKAIVDVLTEEEEHPILVQEFLRDGITGDKRLFLVEGKIRGVIRRVPQGGDHRGNVHVGGTVEACEIDEHDLEIEKRLGNRLVEDGLYFVGIDVIGGRLIEVNVTSPTLLQEFKSVQGIDLAQEIVDSLL